MKKQEQHDYLIALIKELEKTEGNKTNLNNFIIVLKDTLKVKYLLRNYLDYPISAAEYDVLITYAENLLGVNRMGSKDDPHYEHLEGIKYGAGPAVETFTCFCINGKEVGSYFYNENEKHYVFYNSHNEVIATIQSEQIIAFKLHGNEEWNHLASLFGDADCCVKPSTSGRTNGATSADGAQSNSDIVNKAIVDYALINMELVEHILNNYTPDQLTIDIVKEAAAGHIVDGVKVNVIDGMKVNKQTADYIEMRIKQIREDFWEPNAETIAAIEEAAAQHPKDLHSWEDVKKEIYGDETDPNFQNYWGKGSDALFFYASDYIDAWKCADIWHKDIFYWPYNGQYIVGQINPVEWYKTKGDEEQWGPIFGPFKNPQELDEWHPKFWTWWHALSDEDKFIYHNIPIMDNNWPLWNTNYIEMFRKYAAIKSDYDYNKIATEAQNDGYSKMKQQELDEFYGIMPKAFTKEWNEKVAALVAEIKKIESNLDTSQNPFDGEIIQKLEQDLLNLLKGTL